MNLKELKNVIEFLNTIKDEEEKKQLDYLKEEIEIELINKFEEVLWSFESDKLVEFVEETKRNICFDFNHKEIMEKIEEVMKINLWEV